MRSRMSYVGPVRGIGFFVVLAAMPALGPATGS